MPLHFCCAAKARRHQDANDPSIKQVRFGMHFNTFKRAVFVAALGFGFVSIARGGGIEVPQQGARAAGQADAFTAQADDPSAIFYNPAGLTQLKGTNFSGGVFAIFPEFHFSGEGGESMRLPSVLPHLYAETDFGLDRWRFGIGLNDTMGINEDWGNKGPLALLVDKASLTLLSLSPTVSYKVNDHLSAGVALNVYYGELNLRRNVVLGAPPIPEGTFHFRGHDEAVGVTPGIMWKIDDHNTLGAYYRSPYQLDFGGDARITAKGVPEIGPSSTDTTLDFPQSAGIGYALRPIQPLKVEADVIWTDWSSFGTTKFSSSNPAFTGQKTVFDWKSGFTFRLGAQYNVTPHWVLRAGYAYGQNAIPTSTFSPLVPDSNYHLFAAGIGYETDRWSVDLAYQYIYRERRHIHDNLYSPLTDGTWDNQMNCLMLTAGYKL